MSDAAILEGPSRSEKLSLARLDLLCASLLTARVKRRGCTSSWIGVRYGFLLVLSSKKTEYQTGRSACLLQTDRRARLE